MASQNTQPPLTSRQTVGNACVLSTQANDSAETKAQHGLPSDAPRSILAAASHDTIAACTQSAPVAPMHGLPRPLPTMMQYTDNHLMKNRHLHGRPPNPDTRCPCHSAINELNNGNTCGLFLPLSPCGHWIHYKCFVWWITRIHPNQDRCPTCYIRLFDWDGISALTIATRSNIEMEDSPIRAPYNDSVTGKSIFTDSQQYAAECETFERMIAVHFYDHYTKAGRVYVGVNLISVYREVMEEIRRLGMPRSRGLHWTGMCGYLLFGMLVLIKLERWVKETNAGYLTTQGWDTFLQGKKGMRMDIQRAIDES